MTGKQILDMCNSIIKRQDLNRPLLLFYVNNVRKNYLRAAYVFPNLQTKATAYDVIGTFSISANRIKAIKYIEYVSTAGVRTTLTKIPGYDQARQSFDFSGTGVPICYLENGDDIKLLPVPTEGTIEVTAEYYRPDLVDDSTPVDAPTEEISEGIVYLASAEYFDMLDEIQKGQFWRQKGNILLKEYISHLKLRQSENTDLMGYDPLGNLHKDVFTPKRRYDLPDQDMGVF